MKPLVVIRKISQAVFFLLFVYILWSTTYPLRGILPAETFFKGNPLLMFLTAIAERVLLPGLIFAVVMIVLTLVFGRFFCGWVCPLGTTIDVVGTIQKKRVSLSDRTNQKLRLPKFFLLAAIFSLSLVGIQAAWVLDPMVLIGRFVSLNLIPTVTLAFDRIFMFLIKNLHQTGVVADAYRYLKTTFLGVKVFYFSHSFIILCYFLAVVATAFFLARFWCRAVCPLGAVYALSARFSLFRRTVTNCRHCRPCISSCRMSAIQADSGSVKGECILCMDCIYDCRHHQTRFTVPVFKKKRSTDDSALKKNESGLSRRGFIFLLLASAPPLLSCRPSKGNDRNPGNIIRPPAALKENKFVERCIRCGNCMKVCITNGLQPVLFQSGLGGIWTPRLVFEIGYCEYLCTLCGNVCPTGAIPKLSLDQKKETTLGLAKIERSTCLPWAEKKACIVCEEQCPIPDKAIKLQEEITGNVILLKPYVDQQLCVGCGICQTKCPVRPVRAITVYPEGADRT